MVASGVKAFFVVFQVDLARPVEDILTNQLRVLLFDHLVSRLIRLRAMENI